MCNVTGRTSGWRPGSRARPLRRRHKPDRTARCPPSTCTGTRCSGRTHMRCAASRRLSPTQRPRQAPQRRVGADTLVAACPATRKRPLALPGAPRERARCSAAPAAAATSAPGGRRSAAPSRTTTSSAKPPPRVTAHTCAGRLALWPRAACASCQSTGALEGASAAHPCSSS
jgi:hypothetical protein